MNIKPEDVTIIIPHLGGTDEQEYAYDKCLFSLDEDTFKIITVLNGYDKNVSNCIHGSDIEIMEQGQCKAVNVAAATVNTPWLFITNDDMIYSKGWFERLTENLTDEVCVSPVLVEPQDGAPPFIKHFAGGAGGDFDMKNWEGFAQDYYEKEYGIEEGLNFPLLIKKDLWDMVGGYDVNYDPWGSNSDSDLQAKIHLAGAKTYRNRNCIVYHFSTTSGTFHPDNRKYWQKNWDYFTKKWGFERQADKNKVWYSLEIIDYEKLIYRPWWIGQYEIL